MHSNGAELLSKLHRSENAVIEFKAVSFKREKISGPARNDLADELAAFANVKGGLMVLGVDNESKDIIGIPLQRLDSVENYIIEICYQDIEPPLFIRTYKMELPDTFGDMLPILKIEIPRSLFVHQSPGGYFYRQGSSKRQMSPEYLARLFQQRSQARLIRFEEQPVPQTGMRDLSEELWHRFTTRSSEPSEVVLLKRNLLSKEESGDVRASVAGILLCCQSPERFLPHAFIEAVRYRGVQQDSNYQTDAQKIRGPLDQQINQTMAFLKRNQTIMATKKPHRIEVSQFSERAVFEAIVNAVAHRDYSVFGSKIRFFMFDDRLEVYSPGPLPNTVTIDSIALRQATRNELITSLLAETPVAEKVGDVGRGFYMEKRGDGVPIILNESEKLSGKKPVYRLIDDSELLLTIFSARME